MPVALNRRGQRGRVGRAPDSPPGNSRAIRANSTCRPGCGMGVPGSQSRPRAPPIGRLRSPASAYIGHPIRRRESQRVCNVALEQTVERERAKPKAGRKQAEVQTSGHATRKPFCRLRPAPPGCGIILRQFLEFKPSKTRAHGAQLSCAGAFRRASDSSRRSWRRPHLASGDPARARASSSAARISGSQAGSSRSALSRSPRACFHSPSA